MLRFKRKRPGEATADLRAAIALDPGRFNAYVTLAHLDRDQGRVVEAAALLDRAIELKPDLAPLYRTRALWRLEGKKREAALADLDEALRREPPRSLEAAGDHALRGHLLCLLGRHQDALNACDAALEIDPIDAEAHRWRVAALLELKRYDDVLRSCDGYLARGKPSAELLEIRGLAKAHRKDYAGSIADYTQALALKPDRAPLYAHRGWAHLVSDAPKLALLDFEEAVRLDPGSGDAFSGRGSALVLLGQYRSAVADAEEALRHGEPTPRMYYNAARTYAQASTVAAAQHSIRGRDALDVSFRYQDRSLELLGDAMGRIPDDQRDALLARGRPRRRRATGDPPPPPLRRALRAVRAERPLTNEPRTESNKRGTPTMAIPPHARFFKDDPSMTPPRRPRTRPSRLWQLEPLEARALLTIAYGPASYVPPALSSGPQDWRSPWPDPGAGFTGAVGRPAPPFAFDMDPGRPAILVQNRDMGLTQSTMTAYGGDMGLAQSTMTTHGGDMGVARSAMMIQGGGFPFAPASETTTIATYPTLPPGP